VLIYRCDEGRCDARLLSGDEQPKSPVVRLLIPAHLPAHCNAPRCCSVSASRDGAIPHVAKVFWRRRADSRCLLPLSAKTRREGGASASASASDDGATCLLGRPTAS
jgi:hypothetical protein